MESSLSVFQALKAIRYLLLLLAVAQDLVL